VTRILEQIHLLDSVEWIIFEGGEPFLVYPLLLTSVKHAKQLGFNVGIISNGYFGRSEAAATRYLKPFVALGLDRIYISDDRYHYKNVEKSPARKVIEAAIKLGLPTTRIVIGEYNLPERAPLLENNRLIVETLPLMMVGRATERIPINEQFDDWQSSNTCPFKELDNPESIFIDPYGNTQICQGITIGNIWASPLKEIMDQRNIYSHPIYGPLIRNGPKGIIEEYDLSPLSGYIDACHLCYKTRQMLLDRFPEFLSPLQVYNLRV
jgi:MoaA/NifB/PqqE/SkfB family radical SAM enzyme